MTYKYNPFWQQRIRETVRHALNVHPRLTALRVDLRFPDVPAATDAAVISRFINALKARIDAYQKRKHREGKRVHPTTLHYVWAREFGECKGKKHYHLMLLVNRDTWCRAGDYRAPGSLAAPWRADENWEWGSSKDGVHGAVPQRRMRRCRSTGLAPGFFLWSSFLRTAEWSLAGRRSSVRQCEHKCAEGASVMSALTIQSGRQLQRF